MKKIDDIIDDDNDGMARNNGHSRGRKYAIMKEEGGKAWRYPHNQEAAAAAAWPQAPLGADYRRQQRNDERKENSKAWRVAW